MGGGRLANRRDYGDFSSIACLPDCQLATNIPQSWGECGTPTETKQNKTPAAYCQLTETNENLSFEISSSFFFLSSVDVPYLVNSKLKTHDDA